MSFTDDDALERRCRAVVAELDLGGVSTTEDLTEVVAAHLGLSIRLKSFTRRATADVSGGCLVLGRDVVIRYPDHTDRWYEALTVGHELGHLLCGHLAVAGRPHDPGEPGEPGEPGGPDRSAPVVRPAAAALLPDLAEAHQAWQLYRCAAMSRLPEQEAELTGSLLVAHLERPRRAHRSQRATRVAGLLTTRRHSTCPPE